MIELAPATRTEQVILSMLRRTERFSQLFLCAPFIDGEYIERLTALMVRCQASGTELSILTTANTVSLVAAQRARNPRNVVAIPAEHAKVYLALGREDQPSFGLISSSNLTRAGTRTNVELGVYFTDESEPGARLVLQTAAFLRLAIRNRERRLPRGGVR